MVLESAIDALVRTGLRAELREAGGRREDRGPAMLRLAADQTSQAFVIEQRKRAPYIGELREVIARATDVGDYGIPLLVAPYVSTKLGDALIAAGWSWADADGNFDIRATGLRWRQRLTSGPPRRQRARLPRGRAGTAIVRWLLTRVDVTAPIRQAELAKLAGVSQPRVSQILSRLVDLDYVVRKGRQLWLGALEPLLDQFVEESTLLRGDVSYGLSSAPLREVARTALRLGERVAVSADVGLEGVASYRQATHLVLYGAQSPDWGSLDAEASSPEAANLIWRVPEDGSVFETTQNGTRGDGTVRSVDVAQLVADLGELGGADRVEAARVLRSWFLQVRGQR